MLAFCVEKILNIIFKFIAEAEMKNLRAAYEKRYKYVINAVPGTKSYHQFIPLYRNRIGAKRCSSDDKFTCVHNFDVFYIQDEDITIGSYTAVVYDENWWITLVLETFEQERDVKVKFMHPKDFMPGHSEMTFALYQITVYLNVIRARNYSISQMGTICK